MTSRHTGVIVRGGINYRFNWGGPPVVGTNVNRLFVLVSLSAGLPIVHCDRQRPRSPGAARFPFHGRAGALHGFEGLGATT